MALRSPALDRLWRLAGSPRDSMMPPGQRADAGGQLMQRMAGEQATSSVPSAFGGRVDIPGMPNTMSPGAMPFQQGKTFETMDEAGHITNPANPLSPSQAFVTPETAQEVAGLVGGTVETRDYPKLGPGSNPPTAMGIRMGNAPDALDPGYVQTQMRRYNADTGQYDSDPIERVLATQAAGLIQQGATEEARPLIERMIAMGVPPAALTTPGSPFYLGG